MKKDIGNREKEENEIEKENGKERGVVVVIEGMEGERETGIVVSMIEAVSIHGRVPLQVVGYLPCLLEEGEVAGTLLASLKR